MKEGIVTFDEFLESKPDIALLRRIHPELAEYLQGEFADDATVYDRGVVSWKLSSGPTWGMFPVGDGFDFDTGDNIERLIVVNGVYVTPNVVETIPGNYEQIVAPDRLLLDVKEELTYLCLYEPKEKPEE